MKRSWGKFTSFIRSSAQIKITGPNFEGESRKLVCEIFYNTISNGAEIHVCFKNRWEQINCFTDMNVIHASFVEYS
jgi:hypothetical protein